MLQNVIDSSLAIHALLLFNLRDYAPLQGAHYAPARGALRLSQFILLEVGGAYLMRRAVSQLITPLKNTFTCLRSFPSDSDLFATTLLIQALLTSRPMIARVASALLETRYGGTSHTFSYDSLPSLSACSAYLQSRNGLVDLAIFILGGCCAQSLLGRGAGGFLPFVGSALVGAVHAIGMDFLSKKGYYIDIPFIS